MLITTLEYAKISSHTYNINKKLFNRFPKDFTIFTHSIKNISDDGWYYFPEVNPRYTPTGYFFPALYVKYKFGKAVNAVVAFRGTNNLNNGDVDVHTWYKDILSIASSDELPSYYMSALKFFQTARAYVKEYIGTPRVSLTGHSLGGALAQSIIGVGCKPFYAVTFNSPGIGHFKAVNMDFVPWVKNINSRYGFINKIGKPFGEIVYVDVPENETEAKIAWAALRDAAKATDAQEHNHDPLTDALLLNRLSVDTIIASNGFAISVYPQHKIDNMLPVVNGI